MSACAPPPLPKAPPDPEEFKPPGKNGDTFFAPLTNKTPSPPLPLVSPIRVYVFYVFFARAGARQRQQADHD